MFSFGLRAHDFASGEPEEVAAALASYRSLGASAIQLAPYKLFPSWKPPRIDPALARRAAEALGANGMRVAVLGCYINPVHPEPDELERQLARFEDHLSRAADFFCDLVGTETGSASADCSFHPDTSKPETFDRLCRSLERLLVATEAAGARVGVEPVAYQHTVDS
ncbi:MAG TPA: TIM barrel protein, partial [Rectinemataceae bacterium]